MSLNPDNHHRHSIRLKGYDYAQAGAYFVTLVSKDRACLFGEVIDGEMRLNEWGELVRAEWSKSDIIRPEMELDEFIVMPNHVHGIVLIRDVMADVEIGRHGLREDSGRQKAAPARAGSRTA